MNTTLLQLPAWRRLLLFVISALLLSSSATQAQSLIYGLGTLTQALGDPNFFGYPASPVGTQGILPLNPIFGTTTLPTLVKDASGDALILSGRTLVGMDYRPKTGVLYALSYIPASGLAQLYTLQPTTGVATPVVGSSAFALPLGPSVTRIGFDFNPVDDNIRVVATNGTNYRIDPDTGGLISLSPDNPLVYASGDVNSALTPGVGTAAYTNSYLGATSTELYDIDELNGAILVKQQTVDPATQTPTPTSGTLRTVAAINNPISFVNFALSLGLDIDVYYDAVNAVNRAYLIEVAFPNADGYSNSNLYSINLANGQTSSKVQVGAANQLTPFNIYDIAVPITPPACTAPTNLVASNVTDNSATVTFTGSLTALNYTVATSPATTQAPLAAGATSASLTGLAPSTAYTVTITSNCANGTSPATVTLTTTATPSNPTPVITSLSPNSATAGAAAQTLTVNGTGFIAGSTVSFNNSIRTTNFVSATQLSIALTAADQATAGTYEVTVTNPTPGGGTSAPATFTVNAAACNAPSGLAASGITSNSATVTFTGSGTATSYTVTTSPATTQASLAAGATSASLTGLAPSTAYTVTITSNCAGGGTASTTVNLTTTAAPLTDLTVSSAQTISGSYNNVTVTSTGIATLGSTLNVAGTFTVQTGGTLITGGNFLAGSAPCQAVTGSGSFVLAAGANLSICDAAGISATGPTGAILVTGTRSFSPDASYAYNGLTAQTTGSGLPSRVFNLGVRNASGVSLSQATSVTQVLRLDAGNLNTNNQTLTLLSSAASTALVDNTGGVVNGTATVQRYIDPSRNPGLGYRHYSSPVSNSTVADLATSGFTPIVNPAYNTAGNTVTPFPTVFGYNQGLVNTSGSAGSIDFDKGFFSPNALSDALVPTQGYTVNISASELVDFVGTLNNNALSTGSLPRGTQTESGWHLRGNPYPSPLNWSAMVSSGRLSGIDNALYVFKSSGQYAGSYTSYVNGQSTNTGTNVLPLGQGFFVRTSTPGTAGSINFTNAERITTFDATPFQRNAADVRTQLLLSMSNANVATQAAIYFEQGATAGFDKAFDALSLPAPNGLTLASEAGTEALSINGQPTLVGAEVLVPLRVASLTSGSYTLAVDNLANLPTGYHAYLRDALTGTYTDLATTPTTSLTLAANAAAGGRYAVVFTTQNRVLATAPAALAKLATVYPNPAHGTATLLLPVVLRGQQATAVSVVDNLGRTVLTRTLAAGTLETLELPIGGLATGVYSVQARTASGLVVKRLVVE